MSKVREKRGKSQETDSQLQKTNWWLSEGRWGRWGETGGGGSGGHLEWARGGCMLVLNDYIVHLKLMEHCMSINWN